MKQPERRRHEMFRRVDEFGNVYRDLFPADSVAGQAFQVVKTVVGTLGEETVATMRVKRGGQYTRKSAREALIKRLEAMARFAQAMGESKPGFKETFQFPADTSDQALIAAGRLFAHEIEVRRNDIGVPDIHLAGFTELTDQLEQAVKARQSGLDGHTKARASMESALVGGMAAVRTLDAVIPLMLADDPVTLAVWQRDRRIEQGRRGRRAGRPVAEQESAAPEAATPAPVDDPALKIAS